MSMNTNNDNVKKAVQDYYESLAREEIAVKGNAEKITESLGYKFEQLNSVPKEADLGLGCGNPQERSKPQKGETVLDLGSGRGLDCFIASKAVGENGKVFGVDSSRTMVQKASEIAEKNNYKNCTFLYGEIEDIPLTGNSADLVISNCVINLSVDKPKVYSEIYRVLKAGGRTAISDITLKKDLPPDWKSDSSMIKT